MDRVTYDKLNNLMLSDGNMTIEQFRTQLSEELGADAPLVRQLADWEADDYHPGQLLNLRSVLRDLVTVRTPSFRTIGETMKFIEDDINGNKLLRDVLYDLFTAQRLYKWVTEYEEFYARATSPN